MKLAYTLLVIVSGASLYVNAAELSSVYSVDPLKLDLINTKFYNNANTLKLNSYQTDFTQAVLADFKNKMDAIGNKYIKGDKSFIKDDQPYYNFDDAMEYYDNREEYEFVGFIDKELSRRKNKSIDEIKDVFKLREKRAKILEKKRATGIPSLKGAVCSTSKSKKYLDKVAKKIGVELNKNDTRIDVCQKIEDKMLFLEKYSTGKNKFTFCMIPTDHPVYKFPYNLEDRVKHMTDKIKNEFGSKIDVNVKTKKKTTGKEKGELSYYIHIKDDSIKSNTEFVKSLGGVKEGSEWVITIE
jgi:hypothetical protein